MSTKRSRSPPSVDVLRLLADFATRGWVGVPSLLSPSELRVLQAECNALYARESAESLAAQGCVLDVMAQCPMHDSDCARVSASSYLKARAEQLKSEDVVNIGDQQIFASVLFEKLPTVAGQLMRAREEAETTTDVLFFNEHYVVKPPRSHVEFRWHRDDDEQLAMCVHRASIRPYVSAWCALDDVTKLNGALQFVSLDALDGSDEESAETLKRHACEHVAAKAGDVLFFLSNVWHCSSSNVSGGARRAFYAQYSSEKIRARPKDPSPLSFAIPCKRTDSASMSMENRVGRKRFKHDAVREVNEKSLL
ncbi:hypothetical protein PHYPSEUDO_012575 [Phytophthora pseudosyringae]|uniref:Phytanoyl-CoA dioxygenase n=1 Tax=Phytophthora pseudosyringae TaxID=221518 RepID=A0A8T1V7E7_9STRA|nr:hypothetical protein PHYPSEUDO_012575 [Phytophthora pseudosyringae]